MTSTEEAKRIRIFNSIKKSEPFKYDEGLTLESFTDIYPKIKYESFVEGQVVFSHGTNCES